MELQSLIIQRRFCGPPQSGNGGYVCGRLARHLPGSAAVRLKAPPPLETELQITLTDGVAQMLQGSTVIAEGRAAEVDLAPPPPPSYAEAEEAAKSYFGFTRHEFPGCFVCGPQRGAGDGLRIFPGSIESRSLVAAPWIPDTSLADDENCVAAEFLWAALDCTSGFSVLPIPEGKAIVLGELHARIDRRLRTGDRCVAIGWPLKIDGRKRLAGSALFAESGETVAVARATWIEVSLSGFAAQLQGSK